MINYLILISMLFSCISISAHADIFKSVSNQSIVNAVNEDVSGQYYKDGVDYQIDSAINRDSLIGGKVLGESYNLDQGAYFDMVSDGFTQAQSHYIADQKKNIVALRRMAFTDPVRADLLKHFNTINTLKTGIRMQEYVGLREGLENLEDQLRKSALLKCVNQGLSAAHSKGSLDSVFTTCQAQMPFLSIVTQEGVLADLIGEALSEEVNSELVALTGDLIISAEAIEFKGPSKRIGASLDEHKQFFQEKIRAAVDRYRGLWQSQGANGPGRRDRGLGLEELTLPGLSVDEGQIKNLALLDKPMLEIAIAKLASQLAYIKTINEFNKADQQLRFILEDPRLEGAYELFINGRRLYIKEEIAALNVQKELAQEFNRSILAIVGQGDQERINALKQME